MKKREMALTREIIIYCSNSKVTIMCDKTQKKNKEEKFFKRSICMHACMPYSCDLDKLRITFFSFHFLLHAIIL